MIDAIFYSFSALIISLLYLPIYIRTRNEDDLKNTVKRKLPIKLVLCFGFGLLIGADFMADMPEIPKILAAFSLMLITNYDLLLCRIPSEFLLLFYAAAIAEVIQHITIAHGIFCIVIWAVWWIFRQKKIIADYDLWMILPLMIFLNEKKKALLFNALFLILWGIAGLILRKLFRKKPETKIPLVPLMVLAYLLMRRFL